MAPRSTKAADVEEPALRLRERPAPFSFEPSPAVPASAVPFYEVTVCRWVFGRAVFNALFPATRRAIAGLSWCAETPRRASTLYGRGASADGRRNGGNMSGHETPGC